MSAQALRPGPDPENCIGQVIQQYASYLSDRDYAANSVRESVHVAEHFGRWLGKRPLTRAAAQQFLRRHLPVCRCQKPVIRDPRRNNMALQRLLAMIDPPSETSWPELPSGFTGSLLRRYQEHLISVRGLAAGTVRNRMRLARTMLTHMGIQRSSHLSAWSPERIENYVATEAKRRQPTGIGSVTTASRCFLRFLLQEGLIQRDLAGAVPMFAQWKLAGLPKTMRDDELERLLNGPPADTPIGLRDRAILLCLSELGLRAAEVAGLELEGLDLVSGILRFRRAKRGGWATLPIPNRLAMALKAYLQGGRPTCTSRTVFVAHWPPGIGQPIRPVTVSVLVKRWAARVELRKEVSSGHVLRHNLASRMLGSGASLKQIADVLGHRSLDTTTIYAKVDLLALSQVPLPWPGSKEGQL